MRYGAFTYIPVTLLALLFLLASCDDQRDPASSPPSEEPVDEVIEQPEVNEELVGQCFVDQYSAPKEDQDNKLDILIVAYSSVSMQNERRRVVNHFEAMLNQLPVDLDFRVAVMLAHGSHSSHHGRLYRRFNSAPFVLDSQVLDREEMLDHLWDKMNPHPLIAVTEMLFGGGSMGLSSLSHALNGNYESIQSQGFFRDEAALSVIFVSDQSDVCSVYPDGVSTHFSRSRSQVNNSRFNAYQNDCVNSNGDQVLSAQSVFNDLQNRQQGQALSISGFIYNNANTLPQSRWKEMGYGYKELIKLSGGFSEDISQSDYWQSLAKMGSYTATSVSPESLFNLSAQDIYAATIRTYVDDSLVAHFYYPESNQVQLIGDRSLSSQVRIEYCQRQRTQRQNIQVEAGGNHTCALHVDGSVRCWGSNQFGQLGLGDNDNRGDQSGVFEIDPLVFNQRVIQLAAGGFHTCALFEDGKVKCWGRNDFGQLGLGDTSHRGIDEVATELPYLDFGEEVLAIYAGTVHSCALLESNQVVCWGRNNAGQLGQGHFNNLGDQQSVGSIPPIQFSKEVIQLDLSSISNHVCAIFEDRDMKCWGENFYGQLGYGDQDVRGGAGFQMSSLESVSVDQSLNPLFVTTGNAHSCVLLDSFDFKCWGRNQFEQLARPDVDSIGGSDLPSEHSSLSLGVDIQHISAGNISTCATTSLGEVICWGGNNFG